MAPDSTPPLDEELFRLVLESLSDTVVLTDDRGKLTWVGPNVHVIFGRDADDVLALGDVGTLLGNRPLTTEELADGAAIHDRRIEIRTGDGRTRVLLASVKPIASGAGSRLWAFRDVTDLHELVAREHDLADAERRARDRYRRTPAMLHSIDGEGRILEVSDRWLEVLGYERDEVIARRSVEFLTDEARRNAEADLLPRFFAEGSLDGVESQMVTAGGEVRDVVLSAVAEHDLDGRFVRSLAVVTDVTDKRRAERDRRSAEHRFRRIVETVDEGLMVIAHGEVLFASPQTARVLGWSREEFDRRGPADFIHPDDVERVMEIHRRRLAGEDAPSRYEYRVVDEAGEIRWIEMNACHIDWDGRPAALGALRDVTAARTAIDALRTTERRLSRSQGIAHVGSYEFAASSPEVWWSDETYRIVGRSPADGPPSVEEFYREHVHPDDLGWVREQVGRAVADREGFDVEYRVVRPGGEVRHVHSVAEPVGDSVGTYLGTFHDITDFVLTERALAASEERFRRIYEASPLGIGLVDPATQRIVGANPALCELLGYDAAELAERTVDDITHPDDRTAEHGLIESLNRGDSTVYTMEKRYLRRDGSVRWVRIASTVIRGHEPDRPAVGLGLVADITEQHRTERRLRASQRRLRKLATELTGAEERERRRIAQALHDGLAQDLAFAALRTASLAAGLEDGSRARNAADEVRRLLDRCVDAARSMTVELSPPVLEELGLAPALEWLSETILAPRDIAVELELAEAPPDLPEGLRTMLFHAARELLVNVVKHAGARHVRIELSGGEDTVVLVVEDDGAGLVRQPSASSGSFGLYSLGERLTALGGRMALRSGAGGGLRVAVEVPVAPAEDR